MDKIAIKKITETRPLSKLVPEIFAIPIGPNTSFFSSSNLNKDFKPFIHSIVYSWNHNTKL